VQQPKTAEEQRKALVESHLKYAGKIAREFYRERKHFGVEFEEFFAAACLGLCDAAMRFDPDKGYNFRTFSFFRIRGAMYDLLKQSGGISRAFFAGIVTADPLLRGSESDPADQTNSTKLPYAFAYDGVELKRLSTIIEDFGLKLHGDGEKNRLSICYAKPTDPETAACRHSTARYVRSLVDDLPYYQRTAIEQRYFCADEPNTGRDDSSTESAEPSRSWMSRLHQRALVTLRERIIADQVCCDNKVANYEM